MKDTVARFIEEREQAEGRESPAGFHFIDLYNTNKWGFYLRYVRGYRLVHTPKALVFGGHMHSAVESFYVTGDPEAPLDVFSYYHDKDVNRYEFVEDWEQDGEDGPIMLTTWLNEWAEYDMATYDVKSVERLVEVPLANGFIMTVKMDRLMRHRSTGHLEAFDTKTTRYSIPATQRNVEEQDQATAYLLACKKLYPDEHVIGLSPDIIYKRGRVSKAERPSIVTRSQRELAEFEMEIIGLLLEMAQKVKSLADYPPHLLFPRNGKDESFFGSSFPDLYREPLPKDPTIAPPGYEIDPWIADGALQRFIADIDARLRPEDHIYPTA